MGTARPLSIGTETCRTRTNPASAVCLMKGEAAIRPYVVGDDTMYGAKDLWNNIYDVQVQKYVCNLDTHDMSVLHF